jgi:hypothetical protein
LFGQKSAALFQAAYQLIPRCVGQIGRFFEGGDGCIAVLQFQIANTD